MAPLPKRRHSTRRQGKRQRINQAVDLTQTLKCVKCGTVKLSHRACPKCGFYK